VGEVIGHPFLGLAELFRRDMLTRIEAKRESRSSTLTASRDGWPAQAATCCGVLSIVSSASLAERIPEASGIACETRGGRLFVASDNPSDTSITSANVAITIPYVVRDTGLGATVRTG